jgi:uncharacterized protein (DUF58 family)
MKSGSLFIKTFAFICAGICLLVVAVEINIEQMYFMASAMLLAPLIALLFGWLMLWGLRADRRLPTTCREGESVAIEVALTNTGRLPKFFLKVLDRLPCWLEFAGTDGNVILELDPRESRAITYTVEARKRGVFSIGPTIVSATDPFGLFGFAHSVQSTDELVVFPSPLPLRSSLVQPGAFGWRGDEDGLRRGTGVDFHGVREYQHGDDLRRVHWRTTARTGKLAVAEYTQGETVDVVIALDLSATAYAGTGDGLDCAIEYAVKIAATLCEDLTRNGHAVRILTSNQREGEPLPSNAGKWTPPILDVLARADTVSPRSLAWALDTYRSEVTRGSMLIYLTPDIESPDLHRALDGYESIGVLTVGFAFDGISFSGHRATRELNTPSIGVVKVVRSGDDLSVAMQDLFGHQRGVRSASRVPFANSVGVSDHGRK